jgi:hypothetical protein
MNWKPVQEAANVISAASMVWASFRRSSTARSAKVLSDGRVEFPPDRFAYWELPLVVVPTAFATMEALHHRIHSTDQLFFSAAIGFAVLTQFFLVPGDNRRHAGRAGADLLAAAGEAHPMVRDRRDQNQQEQGRGRHYQRRWHEDRSLIPFG